MLFHCWEFPPNGSGVGAYVDHMTRALLAEGHETCVVTSTVEGAPAIEEGVNGRVHRLYTTEERGTPATAAAVLKLAHEFRADLIEGADHLGECAPLLTMKPRPPVLIKLHTCNVLRRMVDSQVLKPWQHVTVRLALWRARDQIRNERRSIAGADILCAPSARMRDEVIAQGLDGGRSIGVVPNPVALRPESEIPVGEPHVLFVGRLDIGKGIQYLPRMVKRMLAKRPDAMLDIVGPDSYARGLGSLKSWLEAQLGSLAAHVVFHGRLGKDALDAAYRRASVVVAPSRWDNFPGAVLDAMAWGRPVVASPHGGMAEMLDGTGCPVVEPGSDAFGDAVGALLENSSRCRVAGAAVRQRARNVYGERAVVSRYLKFLEGAL